MTDLPFDGAISRYFRETAPEAVRPAFLAFRRDYLRTAQFGECLDALKATGGDAR